MKKIVLIFLSLLLSLPFYLISCNDRITEKDLSEVYDVTGRYYQDDTFLKRTNTAPDFYPYKRDSERVVLDNVSKTITVSVLGEEYQLDYEESAINVDKNASDGTSHFYRADIDENTSIIVMEKEGSRHIYFTLKNIELPASDKITVDIKDIETDNASVMRSAFEEAINDIDFSRYEKFNGSKSEQDIFCRWYNEYKGYITERLDIRIRSATGQISSIEVYRFPNVTEEIYKTVKFDFEIDEDRLDDLITKRLSLLYNNEVSTYKSYENAHYDLSKGYIYFLNGELYIEYGLNVYFNFINKQNDGSYHHACELLIPLRLIKK